MDALHLQNAFHDVLGFMGGSHSESVGGAANVVCLTPHPVLKEVGGEGQFMGGTEYGSNAFGPSIRKQRALCCM